MKFKTIRSRIFATLSLTIVLSTTLTFIYMMYDLKDKTYDSFDSVTQTINNILVATIKESVYTKNQKNIQYIIDSIKSEYIANIFILDIEGSVISSQKNSTINKVTYQHFKILKESNKNTLKDNKRYIILNKFEFLEVPLGYLVVEGNIKYYLKEFNKNLIKLITLIISLFLTAIAVAFYLSNRINKPLYNIISTLHNTEKNKLLKFEKESEDEFKYLIKTIEEKHNALKYLNVKLEYKVNLKTAELKSSYKKLEKSNYQKEILLNEIHHRITNSLNLVSSMLGLQQKDEKDSKLIQILEKNRLRIHSIATVHEALYRYDSFEKILFYAYTKNLCNTILNLCDTKIKIKIEKKDIFLPIEDTLRFGIITNELLTNSIKHAFKDNEGEITISLVKTENSYIYKYHDNGKIAINEKKFMKNDALGLKIINMIVKQMKAKMQISVNSGLKFEIVTNIESCELLA